MGDYEIAVLFQGVQYTDTANATNAAFFMNKKTMVLRTRATLLMGVSTE